jgi:hypothetical protein
MRSPGRCARLGVNGEHVALRCTHLKCALGGAAKPDERTRLLEWAYIGMRSLDPVEPAIKIEGALAGPSAFHQVQIFLRSLIPFRLWREVAVALLLGIRLSSDDVEGEATAGQPIEGRDLAGEQRRRDEARPMSHKI